MIQWVALVLVLLWFVALAMAVFERSRRRPVVVAAPMGVASVRPPDSDLADARNMIRNMQTMPIIERSTDGHGIVIPAGGEGYAHCLRLTLQWLSLRSSLPIEVWSYEKELESVKWAETYGATIRTIKGVCAGSCKHAIKSKALLGTGFRHAILIEADAAPIICPEYVFGSSEYVNAGALFWSSNRDHSARTLLGTSTHPMDTSVIVIDTHRHARAIQVISHITERWGNRLHEWTGTTGDSALWSVVWSSAESMSHIVRGSQDVGRGSPWVYSATILPDTNGRPLFVHARGSRWSGVAFGSKVLERTQDGTPFEDIAGDFEQRYNVPFTREQP